MWPSEGFGEKGEVKGQRLNPITVEYATLCSTSWRMSRPLPESSAARAKESETVDDELNPGPRASSLVERYLEDCRKSHPFTCSRDSSTESLQLNR